MMIKSLKIHKKYRPSDYSKYKEFFVEDLITDEKESAQILRNYIPWTKEYYGDWLKDFYIKGNVCMGVKETMRMPLYETYCAFVTYSGTEFKKIQSHNVELIDAEFNKDIAKLPDDIVVHRITTKRKFYEKYGINVDKLKKNQIIIADGYLSTALIKSLLEEDEEYEYKDIYIKIYAPKGCNALYIGFVSGRMHEQEMLFYKNQKLRILDIGADDSKTGRTKITAIIEK